MHAKYRAHYCDYTDQYYENSHYYATMQLHASVVQ